MRVSGPYFYRMALFDIYLMWEETDLMAEVDNRGVGCAVEVDILTHLLLARPQKEASCCCCKHYR